jgi:hypothetical protein
MRNADAPSGCNVSSLPLNVLKSSNAATMLHASTHPAQRAVQSTLSV